MQKSVKLILAVIVVINLAISAFAAVDPEDIVGIWTFDEGSGEDVGDISGNERDGMVIGDIDWVDGKYGQAIEFSGGFVSVLHDDGMNLETFSMTAWVNVPGSVAPYQYVMGKEAWPDRNYAMWILPENLNIGITDNNGDDKQKQGGIVANGEWHHVAGTYDLEFLRVYVDGVETGNIPLSTTPNISNAPFGIAAQPPGGGGPTLGIIDEVGVFSIGLEAEDVQRIMEDGLSMFAAPVEPGGKLCGAWGALKNAY